jgi:surface polysaccharide O-acyltransferase-like enzyme
VSTITSSTTFAPSATERPRAAVAARCARLETLRVIAALAVIWIHVPRSEELAWTTVFCRFAVPLFVASAAYFAVRAAHKPQPTSQYLLARLQRIYLPFLAWSGIYLLFKFAKARLLPDQPNDFPGVEFLWTGGAYHLWFMPLVLVVCCASFLAARAASRCMEGAGAVAVITVITLLALAASLTPAFTSDVALQLMWEALPAGMLGLAIGLSDNAWKWLPLSRATQMASLLLVAIIVGVEATVGRQVTAEAVLGGLLLIVALAPTSTRVEQMLAPLGRWAIGIYFAHLLWIKIVEALANQLHFQPAWQLDLFTFAAAAALALVTAALLARHRATAWLVT